MRRSTIPSSLEWLETIPSTWDERDIGREVWVRARLGWKGLTADEYVDEGVPMLATPDIKGGRINYSEANKITNERFVESPEIMLRDGDVLLTKDGSTIGTVNVVRDLPGPATVNGSIAVLTPSSDLDGRFLYWFIASSYAQSKFDRLRGGMGVPHLFQRDINRIRFPFPPTDEQCAIADYLDRETARIDTLIEEQQRLIEMLRERRQAQIDTAIFEASAKTVHLRRLIEFLTSGSRGWGDYYADAGERFLRIGNLPRTDLAIRGEVQYVDLPPGVTEGERTRLAAGDILFSITAYLGSVAVVEGDWVGGYVSQHVALCRVDTSRVLPRFLGWAMLSTSGQNQLRQGAEGGTKQQLALDDIRDLQAPLPSLAEQRHIAAYLDEQTAKIDTLIAETETFIELSRERRSALITAAVTGQIDVREVA